MNSLEKYQTSVVVIRIAIPKKSILFRYLFGKLGFKVFKLRCVNKKNCLLARKCVLKGIFFSKLTKSIICGSWCLGMLSESRYLKMTSLLIFLDPQNEGLLKFPLFICPFFNLSVCPEFFSDNAHKIFLVFASSVARAGFFEQNLLLGFLGQKAESVMKNWQAWQFSDFFCMKS